MIEYLIPGIVVYLAVGITSGRLMANWRLRKVKEKTGAHHSLTYTEIDNIQAAGLLTFIFWPTIVPFAILYAVIHTLSTAILPEEVRSK